MTPQEAIILANSVVNPELGQITIYGGEPRVNSNLPSIISSLETVLNNNNLTYKAKTPDRTSGVDVILYTNGFGMSDKDSMHRILTGLNNMGINNVAVSTDPPHRDYAEDHGIRVDYDLLDKITGIGGPDSSLRSEVVPEGMRVDHSGNFPYVIPVGRARKLPWKKLLRDGITPVMGYVHEQSLIREKLNYEFDNWANMGSYSHCYCGPARLTRSYRQPDWIHNIGALPVGSELEVNPCGMDIIPPIGNLKEQGVVDILSEAARSRLYGIMSNEGPQGLAGLLTSMDKDSIRERFLDRTPCGMCEDLNGQYGDDINELLFEEFPN